jgi:hypothetical protein
MYQTPVQAPEGIYELSAQVVVSPDAVSTPDAVAAVARFRLEGGKSIVSPETAIATVLVQDEVKRWAEGRTPVVVCFDGNADRLYTSDLVNPNVVFADPQLYSLHVEQGKPICSPVTDGDRWRIILSSIEGPPPGRISAFVDLHEGEFLGVEEGGPEPEPET